MQLTNVVEALPSRPIHSIDLAYLNTMPKDKIRLIQILEFFLQGEIL